MDAIDYDPDHLIEAVRKRPGLWDSGAKFYRSKIARRKLWVEVVKEICPAAEQMPRGDFRELELLFHKKWKSIRDYFVRTIGDDEKNNKPYMRKLYFLLKDDQRPPYLPESGDDTDDNEKHAQTIKLKKRIKLTSKTERTSEDSTEAGISDYQYNEAAEPLQPMPQFSFVEAPDGQTDPDKLFLLSLLPHLRSIPESKKLNAKVELMHVLQNANRKSEFN